MQYRRLGRNGPLVSALGLGCMGMSEFYGAHDDETSTITLHHALACGVTFLDTADIYGLGHNEELIGRAIRGRRNEVIIGTKCGLVRNQNNQAARGVCGRPDYVRASCDASLARLGVDVIDLYYQHRVDPEVPIEETIGTMAELVQAGKIRYIGLSEASAATLRRACAIHPVAALQTELSLWSREAEDEALPACRELGVAFVAYCPLGRGFLTGQIRHFEDLPAEDIRRHSPRFQGKNLATNLALVDRVCELAAKMKCTAAQLALAWVLAQGEDVIPIPGTRRRITLEENIGALEVQLDDEDLARLEEAIPKGAAAGLRYSEAWMNLVNR